jgi:heat shock protein HslJ
MRARRTAVVLLPVLALGFLVGCGGDDDGSSSEPTSASDAGGTPLEGTDWVLDLAQVGAADAGVTGTLRLGDGTASGSSGCNTFSGGYTLDGDELTFSELAGTAMACDDALMTAERAVLDALEATTGYRIDGDTLELTGDDATLLTYEAAAAGSLTGAWTITGYLTADGSALSSPVAGAEATIEFLEDGTVAGSAGCNQMTGSYTAGPGSLTVSQLASTKMMCEEPAGVMDQEAAVLANLESAVAWTVTSTGVDLADAEGTRVLTLAPAS